MSAVRLNSLGTRRGDLELALPDLSAVGISGLQAVRGCQVPTIQHELKDTRRQVLFETTID